MAQQEQVIFVYADWVSDTPVLMGRLYTSFIRGQENFAFEYDKGWLSNYEATQSLDPDLGLYNGRQYTPLDKKLFGFFADSCPDRWGRVLMKRKEAADARAEKRKPRQLTDLDYLLGVYDTSRMGGLRFALDEGGTFLSDDQRLATPPWINLRTLEQASLAFEQDESGLDSQWLNQLLAPGSSLGGARPKASVVDTEGGLWIAKFPSKHDEYNSGAWEKVVHDLAKLCGLDVPESQLETFSKTGSTFLVKRFDRNVQRRKHFSSAMTMLGKTDGASGDDGSGHLNIAAFFRSHGASPTEDLQELWKRIVFNMAVSNTDDHLRNHGFLLEKQGWRLSPLFDVNPIPYGDRLSLNVSEYDNTIDLNLAREVAPYFALSDDEAKKVVAEICKTVSENWERLAIQYGLSRGAIDDAPCVLRQLMPQKRI